LIDFDAVVTELEETGHLDDPDITTDLLKMHGFMVDAGLSADSPDTYKVAIATISFIVNAANQNDIGLETMIEWTGRLATRAYRDLTHHG
jgi:hypothetical protein